MSKIMKKSKKYHYIYKITNNINGKYYIGVHSTDDLHDGYFGSGNAIKVAIKKYGKENFTKEILEFVNSEKEKYQRERELVTEDIVNDPQSYNMTIGGSGNTYGNVNCIDKNGCIINVPKTDPRYLSGELKYMHKGRIPVRDKNNNKLSVTKDDPRYLSGELVHVTKGLVTVKDNSGHTFKTSVNDPRYLSGELVHNATNLVPVRMEDGSVKRIDKNSDEYKSGKYHHITKGTIRVIDNNGKIIRVPRNDERLLNGIFKKYEYPKNLIPVKDKNGNTFQIPKDDPRYISGELIPVNRGLIHVYNINTDEVIKIYPNDFIKYYPQYQFKFVCVSLSKNLKRKTLFLKDIDKNYTISSFISNIRKLKIMLNNNISLPDKCYFGKKSYPNILKKLNCN